MDSTDNPPGDLIPKVIETLEEEADKETEALLVPLVIHHPHAVPAGLVTEATDATTDVVNLDLDLKEEEIPLDLLGR